MLKQELPNHHLMFVRQVISAVTEHQLRKVARPEHTKLLMVSGIVYPVRKVNSVQVILHSRSHVRHTVSVRMQPSLLYLAPTEHILIQTRTDYLDRTNVIHAPQGHSVKTVFRLLTVPVDTYAIKEVIFQIRMMEFGESFARLDTIVHLVHSKKSNVLKVWLSIAKVSLVSTIVNVAPLDSSVLLIVLYPNPVSVVITARSISPVNRAAKERITMKREHQMNRGVNHALLASGVKEKVRPCLHLQGT